MSRFNAVCSFSLIVLAGAVSGSLAQTITVDTSAAGRRQVIDGFGTCISTAEGRQAWWQKLYLDDLGASILRIDLVPRFKSPWSDLNYHSPWFLGSGNKPYAFNFEITAADAPRHYVGSPGNPGATEFTNGYYNGPEGTRVRTYTDATDYGTTSGGLRAPIAVMGPNIDDNIARFFSLAADSIVAAGAIVAAAKERDPPLARFKLVGSIWSPAPWLKVSSGTSTSGYAWPLQPAGVPHPHIWAGNFSGGRLDVSEKRIEAFDDSALPGDPAGPNAGATRGPTSALTQFARSTAAYLRAVQNRFGTRFYAISIQNELNFETFFNSCSYPLSAQYVAALKYVRAELDKYPDLRDVKLMGPEDLLSDSTYSLWQYGSGAAAVHKNLQYLHEIARDPTAAALLSFFCIHGYAADGVASPGANPVAWERWANGWITNPAAGLPATVKGFRDYGKKSWMTETSGESPTWGTVSANGAFSIAVKIHQAITTGGQSAWMYWQTTDGNAVGDQTLTDASQRSDAAKFTAFRHFSRYIRPGAVLVSTAVSGNGAGTLLASAYLHEEDRTLTIVLVNTGSAAANITIRVPESAGPASFTHVTSSEGALWQSSDAIVNGGTVTAAVPASGVVTLMGVADVMSSNPGL
jgi:O-glycosyl hydrolase